MSVSSQAEPIVSDHEDTSCKNAEDTEGEGLGALGVIFLVILFLISLAIHELIHACVWFFTRVWQAIHQHAVFAVITSLIIGWITPPLLQSLRHPTVVATEFYGLTDVRVGATHYDDRAATIERCGTGSIGYTEAVGTETRYLFLHVRVTQNSLTRGIVCEYHDWNVLHRPQYRFIPTPAGF